MKTREKSLFTIGLIVALGVGFVIGISIDFPKPNQSDLAGTFGKAEKFRKVQMTQKDIQLRSELLKDTAQLKSMIQGLVYFSLCTAEVSTNIELSVMAFKAQGMGIEAEEAEKIKALQDYSGFIRNNNKTLDNTIALLTAFYANDTANQSLDVEKSLKDFGSYVNSLNEKNLVLSQAISSLDNFMLTNLVLQAHKTEIIQLKSIRDKLVMKGIQLGAVIGNDNQVHALIVAAFGSQEQFKRITAQEQIAIIEPQARQDLQYADEVQAIAGLGVAGNFIASAHAASVILYDKPGLNFALLLGTELSTAAYYANPAIHVVATVAAINNIQVLSVKLDNYSMQDVIGAMPGRFDAAANLFSMGDMQNAFGGNTGLSSTITQYINANEALKGKY